MGVLGGGGLIRQLWQRLLLARVLALGLLAAVAGTPNVHAQLNPTSQTYTSQGDGEWLSTGNVNLFSNPDYQGSRWDDPSSENANRPVLPDLNDTQGTSEWGVNGFYGTNPGSAYDGTTFQILDTVVIAHGITLSAPVEIVGSLGSLVFDSVAIQDLTVNSGKSLTIDGSNLQGNTFTLEAKGNVVNDGTITNTSANLSFIVGGNFTNNSEVVNDGSLQVAGDLTNNGVFSNTQDLTVLGTFRATADVSNDGGSIVGYTGKNLVMDGSTLDLKNGSSVTVFDAVELQNNANISVSGKNNVIDTAVDAGAGALTITGTSAFDDSIKITGTLTSGSTDISNVTANLNFSSALGTQNITAANGWTDVILAGDGNSSLSFVFGSGNGLNPGNSPGTFNVTDATFQSDSTFYVEIGSNEWNKLIASGTVTFEDGAKIVLINFDDHTVDVNATEVVKATNGIKIGSEDLTSSGGQISSVTDNKVTIVDNTTTTTATVTVTSAQKNGKDTIIIRGVSTTDGTDLNLTVTGADTTPSTPPGSGGPDPTPTLPPVFAGSRAKGQANLKTIQEAIVYGANNRLISSAAAAAIDIEHFIYDADIVLQLDPVMNSLGAVQTFDAVQKFTAAGKYRAYNRVDSLRRGGTYLGQECDPCAPAACNPCESVCNPCDPCGTVFGKGGRDIWFQTTGGWMDQDTDLVEGFTADMWGFAVGVDRKISSTAIVGVAFGGEFGTAKSSSKLNTAKNDTVLVSLYGAKRFGDLFLTGSAGYTGSDLKTHRTTTYGLWAEGKRNADTWFGNFEAAYRFGTASEYLTPFLAYDFVGYSEDAFTERGNIGVGGTGLHFAKRDVKAYFQTLGVKFGGTFVSQYGRLVKPELSLGWLHDYGAGNLYQTASFAGDTSGMSMTLVGASRNKDRVVLGANVETALSQRTTVFLRYDGEFAENYNGQYLTGGFNVKF
jgi:outer membrane autotransporter protein